MMAAGSFHATRTNGTVSVCEMACSMGRTLPSSEVPCCKSTHSASKPWRAMISAEKLWAMESQPKVEGLPSRHICLILFSRIVAPSFIRAFVRCYLARSLPEKGRACSAQSAPEYSRASCQDARQTRVAPRSIIKNQQAKLLILPKQALNEAKYFPIVRDVRTVFLGSAELCNEAILSNFAQAVLFLQS